MDVALFLILGGIAVVVIFSVPYLLWYGRVKGKAEERGRRSDVMTAVVWFGALGVALWERFVVQRITFGGWPLAAGAGLMVLGLAGRLWCRYTLGRYYLPQLKIREDHKLVTHGPYRVLRHPMYTANLVGYVGLTLALGSILGTLLMAVGIFLVFLYRIQVEEALLLAAFGDQYRLYMRQTPHRLIPFVL